MDLGLRQTEVSSLIHHSSLLFVKPHGKCNIASFTIFQNFASASIVEALLKDITQVLLRQYWILSCLLECWRDHHGRGVRNRQKKGRRWWNEGKNWFGPFCKYQFSPSTVIKSASLGFHSKEYIKSIAVHTYPLGLFLHLTSKDFFL